MEELEDGEKGDAMLSSIAVAPRNSQQQRLPVQD